MATTKDSTVESFLLLPNRHTTNLRLAATSLEWILLPIVPLLESQSCHVIGKVQSLFCPSPTITMHYPMQALESSLWVMEFIFISPTRGHSSLNLLFLVYHLMCQLCHLSLKTYYPFFNFPLKIIAFSCFMADNFFRFLFTMVKFYSKANLRIVSTMSFPSTFWCLYRLLLFVASPYRPCTS